MPRVRKEILSYPHKLTISLNTEPFGRFKIGSRVQLSRYTQTRAELDFAKHKVGHVIGFSFNYKYLVAYFPGSKFNGICGYETVAADVDEYILANEKE